MKQKQSGPRCIGGSGGPGGKEDGWEASSAPRISRPAPKRPGHSRKARLPWWITEKWQLRVEEVDRRWPGSKILGGYVGDHAVVSHCRDQVRVSLHKTKANAEAVKAKLDQTGCDPMHWSCAGEHEIADLSTGYDTLADHLHQVRAAWRDV